ncbi:MAG: Holliday junction branch migration protein RuvA [Bdellovibrionales bacterium]|nr:Holliday junction branch migration protein RuvA [Bdellovibrionales bacterium]
MIARLRGVLIEKSKERVVVDVNGAGYGLLVPETVLHRLPEEGGEVTLQVHTAVREDAITLYGFLTRLEREVFEILMTANGVGPKMALSVLSALDARAVLEAIAAEDKAALHGISGVGKKTADRLILELREKCGKRLLEERGSVSVTPARGRAAASAGSAPWAADLEQALLSLGWREADARVAVREALARPVECTSLEAALKFALKTLSAGALAGGRPLRGMA